MSVIRRVKDIVRPFVPPILKDALARTLPVVRGGIRFAGNYPDWATACRHAAGYDDPSILEKAVSAALRVERGEVPYERDTVVFDRIDYSFPLLAALLYAASRENGRLSVLDFGGALGSSYQQNKGFLGHLEHLRWSIVEQPHFVGAGQLHLGTEVLRFYGSVEECAAAEKPNFVLLSSVLQYLEDPYLTLSELEAIRAPYLLIDRTPVLRGLPGRITVQTVPPEIYSATYPCRIFGYQELEQRLLMNFDVLAPFEAHPGTLIDLGDAKASYAGWILERRGHSA